MKSNDQKLLEPLKQLLDFTADYLKPELARAITTLNSLLGDAGKDMNAELKARWKERLDDTFSAVDEGTFELTPEMEKLVRASLHALDGRFFDIVEKDFLAAALEYEEAAGILDSVPISAVQMIRTIIMQYSRLMAEASDDLFHVHEKFEKLSEVMKIESYLRNKTLLAHFLDWAADAYLRAQGETENARRCYKRAIDILTSNNDTDSKLLLCHLCLSLADLLLSRSDEWEEVERLYRLAADSVFFTVTERKSEDYHRLCNIVGAEVSTLELSTTECVPHVELCSIPEKYRRDFTRLKADLAQQALATLKQEFAKTKEWPVPGVYYLLGSLCEHYCELREYEKCAGLECLDLDLFNEGVFFETFLEVDEYYAGAFALWHFTKQTAFAKGLLQRPDYKEFLEQLRKAGESHERMEWRQMRIEKGMEARKEFSLKATKDRLVKEKPWLTKVSNLGSVANAEAILEQLKTNNWGEVVVGFCNAVEEELESLYKGYRLFRAERFLDHYDATQSQRRNYSPLYDLAGIKSNNVEYPLWKSFVEARFPKQNQGFLLNDLPNWLSELKKLRNPSAHGKMIEREDADRAREIVLGGGTSPGLLQALVSLNSG